MTESSDTAITNMDGSGETSELCTVVDDNEEPPKYSSRISTHVSNEPPPPPYTIPLEQPPAYELPASPRPSHSDHHLSNISGHGLAMHCQRPRNYRQASICQPSCLMLALACAVFWFCGFLFGGTAYVLARLSMRKSHVLQEQRMNKCFGRASILVSVLGIASGAVILTFILSMYPRYWTRPMDSFGPGPSHGAVDGANLPIKTVSMITTTKMPSSPCAFANNKTCYLFASFFGQSDCQDVAGVVAWDIHTSRLLCYHNVCRDYTVDKQCFKFRSTLLNRESCFKHRGLYVVAESGMSCYYNQCPGFQSLSGGCFKSRRPSSRTDCSNSGYYEAGYCYYS